MAHAEIERIGRHTWTVRIIDGLTVYGPYGYGWVVRGSRERAIKRACKELQRYRQKEKWQEEKIIIEGRKDE